MAWKNNKKTRSKMRSAAVALIASICLFGAFAGYGPARADAVTDTHGLSTFGTLKYPRDFAHFNYVNPNAPKGGTLRISAIGTFDSLNPFIIRGQPGALSSMIYDELFTSAYDEALTQYGLIAESASYPADYSSVTYKLRPAARWHDGKPITPEDVIFSFTTLKAAHPRYAYYYQNVVKAEKTGDHQVTFTFDQSGNLELPEITAQLTILPKHYWEGTDADGNKRDIMSTTLDAPLGSGPYRITKVKPGTSMSVERVADYWAKDLNVNVGRYNFDVIKAEYFRDTTVALEAFKSDQFDVRFENSAKRWATDYTFPAALDKRVVLEVLKTKNPEPMQAFIYNSRRSNFSDPRVRRAFNYAFDFDWANKNLFFGQYTRVASYFAGSELEAKGLPKGLELEILEELRGQIPDEVFTEVYENPTSKDQAATRKNLRAALRLLKAAGWTVQGGKLVSEQTGKQMTIEFMLRQGADFERIVLPYTRNLERLGVKSAIRSVDVTQYQNRIDEFDFDVVIGSWGQSLSPGNEQRDYWGSAAADRKGSRNQVGIKDPAIDKLIDRIIFSKNREEQIAATHALDRVLLWNHFVVPQWYFKGSRVARWDRFGIPEVKPDYAPGYPDTWWYDAEKAAAVKGN